MRFEITDPDQFKFGDEIKIYTDKNLSDQPLPLSHEPRIEGPFIERWGRCYILRNVDLVKLVDEFLRNRGFGSYASLEKVQEILNAENSQESWITKRGEQLVIDEMFVSFKRVKK